MTKFLNRTRYICSDCNREYPLSPEIMLCPKCSNILDTSKPLRGILDIVHEYENLQDIFSYLPIEKEFFPNIIVGNTPLWKTENLSSDFDNLFIKDDSKNPTCSLKDRASYLVAAQARKFKINEIAVASTGNAASSMAGIGAASGIKVTIFVPENIPRAKLIQSIYYGAKVIKVKGSYEKAYNLSIEYSRGRNILSRNTAYNPMTIAGKKTVSLEIFRQLKRIPDYIFVPVGDAVILCSLYRGFKDLYDTQQISGFPTIIGVQSSSCCPLVDALKTGKFKNSSNYSGTIADSIAVKIPKAGYYAIKMIKKYGGNCLSVADVEILKAQRELSLRAGVFAEPAAAASFAGFKKLKNDLKKDSIIVILITGCGLKDLETAKTNIDNNKNKLFYE